MAMVFGIDLGTTNIKGVLVEDTGVIRGIGRVPITYDRDSTGRCELEPGVFRTTVRRCVDETLRSGGVDASQIEGVSYSSQANTFLLLDPGGEAITPIISWQDKRVREFPREVELLWGDEAFLETTGLGLATPQMAVSKLLEMKHAGMLPNNASIMTLSDYLIYLLTGNRVGDSSTASLLGLFDLTGEAWWSRAFLTTGLDKTMFSVPARPGSGAGLTVVDSGMSIPGGVPVFVGGLDHYIGAIGSGASTIADLCESTGTVLSCLCIGEVQPAAGACVGPGLAGRYFLTFESMGGAMLQRYRDERCPTKTFSELDGLAALVAPGSDGTIASVGESGSIEFAYSGVDWVAESPELRIGREVRAILEATAYKLKRLIRIGGFEDRARIVSTGGGAKSRLWNKIKAAVTGMTFLTVRADEPAAYGAAFLAARGTGQFAGELVNRLPDSWISVVSETPPDPEAVEFYDELAPRYGE